LFAWFLLVRCRFRRLKQGCQIVYFQTKNRNSGIFGRPRNETFWYVLWTFWYF
jgi:hypothetical protein